MTRRVLFFVETPHRFAGAQKALLAMLRPIARYGIEPLVVFPGPGIATDAFREAGLRVIIEPAPPSLLVFERGLLRLPTRRKVEVGLREVLPYSLRIAALARRERVEVAHFNQLRGLLLAGLALRMTGIPLVLHLHGMPNFGSRASLRLGAMLASRIVLCADAIRPALDVAFRRKTATVHNGLPPVAVPDHAAARSALLTAAAIPRGDAALVVTLSTRTAFKGLHHLVDAIAELRRRGRDVVWVVLGPEGEASYARFLDARIRALDPEGAMVRTLGFRRDAVALLAGADLFVLPTVEREVLDDGSGPREVLLTEGLPMSILEALAMGVPVVATDVAGVREQLDDGITGRVVRPSDPRALADGIDEVLADAAMRERARRLGPQIVRERFSIEKASAELARVLADV